MWTGPRDFTVKECIMVRIMTGAVFYSCLFQLDFPWPGSCRINLGTPPLL